MSRSIAATVPHNPGAKAAIKRVAERIELLRHDYIDKVAQLDVPSDSLRIEVQLPWILAALSNKFQGILTSIAKHSLQIEHTLPKS
jgi:hypothetical protein